MQKQATFEVYQTVNQLYGYLLLGGPLTIHLHWESLASNSPHNALYRSS